MPQRLDKANELPDGLSPADIAAAYQLRGTAPAALTVAIVDAYDDPNADSDMAKYRQTYGLTACTMGNGCFQKVGQHGPNTPLPPPDSGWAAEVSLDLDAVSAACPSCSILLVEADSDQVDDMSAGVDTAVALGARVVSNSYGTNEFVGMDRAASHYRHPGTAMVVSSGDRGFTTADFPAVLSTSIAVGGTSLTRAPRSARGWAEQAWSGSGSGCSAYVPKPSWQRDKHCSMRTVADISAVADPNTGLAVYDTYDPYGQLGGGGFFVAGGTSLSAPLIAAMIARSGTVIGDARTLYPRGAALFDPVGGSNGFCGHDYLCTGVRGYDAPTGTGTPDGLAAL